MEDEANRLADYQCSRERQRRREKVVCTFMDTFNGMSFNMTTTRLANGFSKVFMVV